MKRFFRWLFLPTSAHTLDVSHVGLFTLRSTCTGCQVTGFSVPRKRPEDTGCRSINNPQREIPCRRRSARLCCVGTNIKAMTYMGIEHADGNGTKTCDG
jgi:hypothetical protein